MLLLAMGVLAGVAGLSIAWEFYLEAPVMTAFFGSNFQKPLEQQWEIVITAVIFAGLALVVPTALLSVGLKRREALTQELERESRILRTTLETINQGICVYDKNLRLAAWNAKYIKMAQHRREMVTRGRPAQELIRYLAETGLFGTGDLETVIRDRTHHYFERGERTHEIRRRLDGRILEVERLPMADGGSVSVFTDVTDRILTEQSLQAAKEEAESASRTKNQILANISHELRTPLNAVIGLSDVMKAKHFGPLGDPRYNEYIEDINDAARHLLLIINDLLDISRIEAGAMVIDDQNIAIDQLIRSSERLFREVALKANVTLEVELPDNLPYLFGDAVRVRQILINLVSNVVKFTNVGGWVTVSAAITPSGEMMIAVADTGIGIPEDQLKIVMAPFMRAEETLTRKYEGTGLGLHLSQRLVDLHQGSLAIESEVGRGTTVTITFPQDRVIVPELAAGTGPAD